MTELTEESVIQIDMVDLAAILTEAFCGSYTPFKNLYVDNVWKMDEDGSTFAMSLAVKDEEAA